MRNPKHLLSSSSSHLSSKTISHSSRVAVPGLSPPHIPVVPGRWGKSFHCHFTVLYQWEFQAAKLAENYKNYLKLYKKLSNFRFNLSLAVKWEKNMGNINWESHIATGGKRFILFIALCCFTICFFLHILNDNSHHVFFNEWDRNAFHST